MSLLTILLVIIVLGVVLWAINTYLPMDPKFKTLLNVIAIVVTLIWLAQAFGLLDTLSSVRIHR